MDQKVYKNLTHDPIRRAPDPTWRQAFRRMLGLAVLLACLTAQASADVYGLLMDTAYDRFWGYASMSLGIAETYTGLRSYGIPAENLYVLDAGGPSNTIGPYGTGNLPSLTGALLIPLGFGDSRLYVAEWTGSVYALDFTEIRTADDYDGDGIGDVDGPHTLAGLTWAVGELARRVTADDLLLVVMDSVGETGGEFGGYTYGTYGYGQIPGAQLAALIDTIPCRQRAFLAMTCYSAALGQFIARPGDNTVLLSSTDAVSSTWTLLPEMYRGGPRDGEWVGNRVDWMAAAAGGLVNADADGDLSITWRELYLYAAAHDQFADLEFPTLTDPDGLADSYFRLAGDANWDGTVDVSDLAVLAGNFRKTSGQTWAGGDFTGDGMVDVSDLSILAGNYRTESSNPVPEPGTLVLLAGGVLYLLRKGVRR